MVRQSAARAFWTAAAGAAVLPGLLGDDLWGFFAVAGLLGASFFAWPRLQQATRAEAPDVMLGAMFGGTLGALAGTALALVTFARGMGIGMGAAALLLTYALAGLLGGGLAGLPLLMSR